MLQFRHLDRVSGFTIIRIIFVQLTTMWLLVEAIVARQRKHRTLARHGLQCSMPTTQSPLQQELALTWKRALTVGA